jgi:uncharacterized repeat protein (TIGR03803 family)
MRKLKVEPYAIAVLALTLAAPILVRAQTYSVLYDLGTNSGDPVNPSNPGVVAQGRDGNLYTTATDGGANGLGAVFEITPHGALTVLYNFDGTHGSNPNSGLTLGTDGNFYGTTKNGGSSGAGTVFKITPKGSLTVLYSFTGGSDGGYPDAPPIEGDDGILYGTTTHGGSIFGTVYKITRLGVFTSLYQFDQTPHGSFPIAPLVQGTDKNFYGVTETGGGTSGVGVVYKITKAGELTVLYDFDGTHGEGPVGALIQGSDGDFYGTAWGGGAGYGVAFKMTPSGAFEVLHSMNGGTDGGYPEAGLVQGTDGSFYGTNSAGDSGNSYGTIFQIGANGNFSVLHSFDFANGESPNGTLVQHTGGILFGDTVHGGTVAACFSNCGVFYSLNNHLPPFVNLLPYAAKVGKTVEFLGQGFKGVKAVSFNGRAASFKVVTNTYMTATVPEGATTGFVTVTTAKGKLKNKKKFRVIS